MSLTDEQLQVVAGRARTNFVSAAAGSGKTSLLVECYVRALLEDGLLPEELPTVTFTRRAAGEMRARIREHLMAAGREDLARALQSAPIDTIHAFCRRLLAGNPVQAGIDPQATTLDEERAQILRHQVWSEVWRRRVEQASAEDLSLLARFRAPLEREVPRLYQELRTSGLATPVFAVPPPSDPAPALAELSALLEELGPRAAALAPTKPTAETIARSVAAARAWLPLAEPSVQSLRLTQAMKFPLNCPNDLKPLVGATRQALTRAREALAGQLLAPLAALAAGLLQEFHEAYAERKRAEGYLDFEDLELKALASLQRSPAPYGPRARLLVDEFQDTNQLQCRLFDRLGVGAVLTVGDEYQSIYGFRGAEVEVFRRRREEVAKQTGREAGFYRLTRNFRSRAPILAAINCLFGSPGLFGSEFTFLRPGRSGDEPREDRQTPPGQLSPAVEILVLDREEAKLAEEEAWQAAEARVVAERVGRLIGEEGWQARDVVILLAAFTHVELYADALDEFGVDAYVVGGRGYYSREEVTDILALLDLLLNPHDDRALVTVLRSPLVDLSDDALYLLRKVAKRTGATFLWQAVDGGEAGDLPLAEWERLAALAARLRHLRRHLGLPGLSSLIEEALRLFDYDLALLAAPQGVRRFANLRKLMRLADEFEELAGPDLPGLLAYLRDKGTFAAKEGSAPVLSEEQNVVRIMTIHQAKGLEFPLVVVAGAGSEGRPQDHPTFLVGPAGQGAVFLKDSKLTVEDAHLCLGPGSDLRQAAAAREAEERLRLYYVALTRAEERLILAGSLKLNGKSSKSVLSLLLEAAEVDDLRACPELRPSPDLDLVVRRAEVPLQPVGPGAREALPEDRPSGETIAPPEFLPLGGPQRSAVTRASFSALALYRSCPFRFYLERVLNLHLAPEPGLDEPEPTREEPGRTDEIGGREVGSLVHRCLELVSLVAAPADEELLALTERVGSELGVRLSPAMLMEAAHLTAGFWRSPFAGHPGLEHAKKEQPFVFAREGVLISGVMDLVLRNGSTWLVVDYKTNRVEDCLPEDVVAPYVLQAQIYALAGLLADAPEVQVAFVLLQRPEEPVTFRYGREDLPKLLAALDQALEGPVAGRFPRGEGCESCTERSLCAALAEGEDSWDPPDSAWTAQSGMV